MSLPNLLRLYQRRAADLGLDPERALQTLQTLRTLYRSAQPLNDSASLALRCLAKPASK